MIATPDFPALARAVDGYVLQAHSFERPATSAFGKLTLCDPELARSWVEQAGRLGVPFLLSLPTYGYLVGFDSTGRLLGMVAEGAAADLVLFDSNPIEDVNAVLEPALVIKDGQVVSGSLP